VTWNQLTGGLPTTGLGRIEVAVTAANPARIYAVMGNIAGSARYVYASTDSGASWAPLAKYANFCGYSDTDTTGQCDYDLSAAAYPLNQDYLYVGGIRLEWWDGTDWTILGYNGIRTDGIHVDFHTVTFDAQNPDLSSQRVGHGDTISGTLVVEPSGG
jgi:hypothetical protein